MILLIFSSAYCFSEAEQVELVANPAFLSDFITARQFRNLTVSGKKEIAPIDGRFFRKPLINLMQSLQPNTLELHSLCFNRFDGMVLKGEARGMAKFPSVLIQDCKFVGGNTDAIYIRGPEVFEGKTNENDENDLE